MKDTLYIAWRYILYHRAKSVILVVSLTLILYLPVALQMLVRRSEEQLLARAASTPLLVGAKGSSLDLAIHTLYFEPKSVELISMADVQRIEETGLAMPIPLYTAFQARGYTIVGTTLEYFAFRNLEIRAGRQIAQIGECVLGAAVARSIGVKPGEFLLSSPESLFDLAGVYPLKMQVVGVLEPTRTPDDRAVFVDIKTAWIIRGLGHGHQDLEKTTDSTVLLQREGNRVTANAKLVHYNEITEANVDSFHFHGDTVDFPLTAILAVPRGRKEEDLLRGRYLSAEETRQIFRPLDVIRDLTATIFKVKGVLDSAFLLIAVSTFLLVALVTLLSLRLRRREMETLFKLGCGRWKIVGILTSELAILGLASVAATGGLVLATSLYLEEILRALILS